MQQSDQPVIICPEHQEQIISMKEDQNGNIVFFCMQCLMKSKILIHKLPQQLNQLAQEKINNLKKKEQKSEKEYDSLKQYFISIQKQLNESINKIIDEINGEIKLLKDTVQKEIEQLRNEAQQLKISEINNQLKNLKQHEILIGQQNFDQFKVSVLNSFSNLYQTQMCSLQHFKNNTNIKYRLKYKKQEQIYCRAMTMIQNDSILINSNYNDIQIWNFNFSSLELCQTLSAHGRIIRNLFAFKDDQFISASLDCLIIWKKVNSCQWEILEKLRIRCVNPYVELPIVFTENLLVYYENQELVQLFVNSQQIWKEIRRELSSRTSISPIFLSICPSDQEIKKKKILVYNNETFFGKSILERELAQNDNFLRMSYTDENEIVGTTKNGYFYSYKVANDEIELLKQKIYLNNKKEMNPSSFPIIYHQKLKMILCRHSSIVYILKKDQNDQYQITQELHGLYLSCYISKDGNFIILGTANPFQFEVWEIF